MARAHGAVGLTKRQRSRGLTVRGRLQASFFSPHFLEQKRIAAILDAADALRAKRRESIEQLDSLIQSTFLEMFGDPVSQSEGVGAKKNWWTNLLRGSQPPKTTFSLSFQRRYG